MLCNAQCLICVRQIARGHTLWHDSRRIASQGGTKGQDLLIVISIAPDRRRRRQYMSTEARKCKGEQEMWDRSKVSV